MRQLSRKIIYLLVTAAAVLSAAGCSGANDAPAQSAAQTSAPLTTAGTPAETAAPVTTASEDTQTGPAEITGLPDSSSEETEPPDSGAESTETAETADSVTESVTESGTQSVTAETPPETTAEKTAGTTAAPETSSETTTTTAASATTTTTTTTTTATTTTTTTAAPPAAPSPPQIKAVSSPGSSTFSAENVVFDYSNAGVGYVSVDYSGTTRLKLLLKNGSSQFDYDIYPGRGIQYITLAQGSGTYTVEIYEMLDSGKFINAINENFTANIADEIGMFLYRNCFVEFGANSACVAKASEVCAGCGSDLDKIAAVFKWVTDNITYDREKAASVTSGYIPDPDKVLAAKKGICFDYASLTAAMLRSQGVPTRLITGYASPNIYHAWNEVYTPATGWIAVEIMLDGTGFRRIDATFYASAQNKQSFADYIADSSNYTNVYIY